jgi:hypothetical protein
MWQTSDRHVPLMINVCIKFSKKMVSLSITLQHNLTIFGPSIVHDMHMSTVHVSPDLDLMFTGVLLPLFILMINVCIKFSEPRFYGAFVIEKLTESQRNWS